MVLYSTVPRCKTVLTYRVSPARLFCVGSWGLGSRGIGEVGSREAREGPGRKGQKGRKRGAAPLQTIAREHSTQVLYRTVAAPGTDRLSLVGKAWQARSWIRRAGLTSARSGQRSIDVTGHGPRGTGGCCRRRVYCAAAWVL